MIGTVEPLDWLTRKLVRLGPLDQEDRVRLAQIPLRLAEIQRYRQVVREGAEPDQCCLLVEGFAARYKEATTGERQIVSFHLRGDILDIQHLLLTRADHSVQTITDCVVGWVPKAELVRLASDRPNIGRALWRDSLIDASIFREWVLNVGRREAKSRIAHLLCEFAARCEAAGLGTAQRFAVPLTQQQIADATGLTPVHVNRMLKALEEDGVLQREGRQFLVPDLDRLRKIADFDPSYLHAAAA